MFINAVKIKKGNGIEPLVQKISCVTYPAVLTTELSRTYTFRCKYKSL